MKRLNERGDESTLFRPDRIAVHRLTGANIYVPHHRKPQDRIWAVLPSGHKVTLWRGNPARLQQARTPGAFRGYDMAIAKRAASGAGGTGAGRTAGCDLSKRFPSLFSFLVDETYEGGEVRTPGSMTVFRGDEGGLKLCLVDKDTQEVAFLSGDSLSDLLETADGGIESGTLDWRVSKRKYKK